MAKTFSDYQKSIDQSLQEWKQGDIILDSDLPLIHIADLSRPLTDLTSAISEDEASENIGVVYDDEIEGFVVLTQTCDIVRFCGERPYVSVSPLVSVSPHDAAQIKSLAMPRYATVPGIYDKNLVTDLDRVMTLEKSILVKCQRKEGCATDEEIRNFSAALARHKYRFAFPNDFVVACKELQKRIGKKHDKNTSEGAHLSSLEEIRIRAAPSWDAAQVNLTYWFIIYKKPENYEPDWLSHISQWISLIDQTGRFKIEAAIPCYLEDITARDYVESDRLDLDRFSS